MILSETTSVCPVCLQRVPAAYVKRGRGAAFEKTCATHGAFSCVAAADAADFEGWKTDAVNIPPKTVLSQSAAGCPQDCGPCAAHLQTACCVLLDITGRCDQRCPICFASAKPQEEAADCRGCKQEAGGEAAFKQGAKDRPAAGGEAPDCRGQKQDPLLAAIEAKYDALLRLSEERTFNIQLSGGEPAVREDLPQIIAMAKQKGFAYVQVNTNGKRIGLEEDYAQALRQAGADAVFMQFDGISDAVYERLRGEKLLEIKKKAVEHCRKARLPVALVPTLVRGVNDEEIGGLIRYMLSNVDVVKGIHFQPVSFFGRYPGAWGEKQRLTMFDVMDAMERQTGGLISKSDFLPISTGHPLCCFYATYLKGEDGGVTRIGAAEQPAACCPSITESTVGGAVCAAAGEAAGAPSASCCPTITEPIADGAVCATDGEADGCRRLSSSEVIAKDRDYVLQKWKMAPEPAADADGLDLFLNRLRQNSFTLTGMAFQDAMTLDTERLRRCRVQVFSDDHKLIPFCAYNLTDTSGQYLYRGRP